MEYLSRVVERFPLWTAGGFLVFTGVSIWFLTRLDEFTRTHVESSRYWWGSTSTFETEFKKVRLRGRVVYSMFIAISLLAAIVIVCAHLLV